METLDYRIAWLVYVAAGLGLCFMAWRVFKKYLWRELAYLLVTTLIAIIFTPWYVIAEQDVLAPAVIVFAMDTITIDITAGVRGLIPLVMALALALLITIILSVVYRIKKKKSDKARLLKKRQQQETIKASDMSLNESGNAQ